MNTPLLRNWRPLPATVATLLFLMIARQAAAQATFYEDINYGGASFPANADMSFVGWDWNDRISSLRVPVGLAVILYQNIDFGGASLTLTSDAPDLRAYPGPGADGTWNDAASSIRISCDPSGYGGYPTDNNPDDWAIQQCLNRGGTTTLHDGSPGYQITNTLRITVSGTTLLGVDASRAHVVATTTLDNDPSQGKRMLDATGVNNVTLSNIFFDGMKNMRNPTPCAQPSTSFDYGKNIKVVGDGFRILNITSSNALCGSGAEVYGSGFEVAHSLFRDNGYPENQSFGVWWADGLTVWKCGQGSSIHDNNFVDNTDVDLVIGGSGGESCSVSNNYIENFNAHGFAGIHIGWFDGGNGNHNGVTYSGNRVYSGTDMLAFGIMVGFHPWDSAAHLGGAGSVSTNDVAGAVVNLQIEADSRGVATGTVTGNNLSNAQGSYGFGSCTIAADYAVYPPHAGLIAYDGGYLVLQFDDLHCFIR